MGQSEVSEDGGDDGGGEEGGEDAAACAAVRAAEDVHAERPLQQGGPVESVDAARWATALRSCVLGREVALGSREQYPKGLGKTLEQVRAALPAEQQYVEKLDFSCAVPEVMQALDGRPQVLVCGMETHVWVFQTVRDLAGRGFVPFVCADAVLSRFDEDRTIGLARNREAGAVVTTVEGALFDLLGRAGTPEFKRVSAAVK